jgi:uncharacterized protein YjiS (DUF1127 family)
VGDLLQAIESQSRHNAKKQSTGTDTLLSRTQAAENAGISKRRAVELLKEMKMNGQRQKAGDNRKTSHATTSKLSDLGITRDKRQRPIIKVE